MTVNKDLQLYEINGLLKDSKRILKHNEEIKKLKGEDFNIFSILNMERLENITHSSFISELLKPNGSHHKGNLFLKLFLETTLVNHGNLTRRKLDITTFSNKFLERRVEVSTEKSIGNISSDKEKGGRIDVLIKSGNDFITIENKIDAKDQYRQLSRYSRYQQGRNVILYLTLFGEEPSDESKGDLTSEDYKCISYSSHIRLWLEKCVMHAHNEPILRESLKQYLILINKITHQMNNELQESLNTLLKQNLKTAELIHHGFYSALKDIKNSFRSDVYEALRPIAIKHDLSLEYGNSVEQKFSQIWLKPKNIEQPELIFGVESFSGNINVGEGGKMFYGIVTTNADNLAGERLKKPSNPEKATKWWPSFEWIMTDYGNHLNLSSTDLLSRLAEDKFSTRQIDIIVINFGKFIDDNIEDVLEINSHYAKGSE